MTYLIPRFEEITLSALAVSKSDPDMSIEHRAYQCEHGILTKWFAEQEGKWSAERVRLAGLAIYGWMPTILRAEGRNGDESGIDFKMIAENLNLDRSDSVPFDFLNRSVVGTSKFLHFWRPQLFAIWDSNIRSALDLSAYGDPKKQFESYIQDIRVFADQHKLQLREIEFAIFRFGKLKRR